MSLNPNVMSAVLVRLNAGSDERLISLGRPLTVVGSKGHARLRLLSSDVSGSHAVLLNIANNYFIRDLMSRAGVLVNEQPVRETRLKYGDVIGIGNFRFRFEDAGLLRQPPMQFRAPPGVLHVPDQREALRLDSMLFVIGRQAGANLVLEGSLVSKAHALIFEHNGVRLIRDLASRHGTFVNGENIHEVVLRDGDLIQIGNAEFRYSQLSVQEASSQRGADSHGQIHLNPMCSSIGEEEPVASFTASEVSIAEHRFVSEVHSKFERTPLRLNSPSEGAFAPDTDNFGGDSDTHDEDSNLAWVLERPDVAEISGDTLNGRVDDVSDLESLEGVTDPNSPLADSAINLSTGPSDPQPSKCEASRNLTLNIDQVAHKPPPAERRPTADAEDSAFLQPMEQLEELSRLKSYTPPTDRASAAQVGETSRTCAVRPNAENRITRPKPGKLKDSEQLAAILGPGMLTLAGGETLDEAQSLDPRPRAFGGAAAIAAAAVLGVLSLIAAGTWFFVRRH